MLNAHVVLRAAKPYDADADAGAQVDSQADPEAYVLPLSARTPQALLALAHAYVAYLGPHGAGSRFSLGDICYSAATRREHHPHRLAVVGASHQEMIARLRETGDSAVDEPLTPLNDIAQRYRNGHAVAWADLFDRDHCFVPLPTYPWQTRRYWLNEPACTDELADPVTTVLRKHARAEFSDDSTFAEIGIDSLAVLGIVVELGDNHGYRIDPADLADFRTVGAFREWFNKVVAAV